MSTLIIGCGYLGRRIAHTRQQLNEPIFVTTRNDQRAAEFAAQGLHPVVCDVLDLASLARLPKVKTVVYCVGFDRSIGVSMERIYVEGVKNVLSALPGSPRIVYVSSTSVYGQTDGEIVNEQDPTISLEESGKVVLAAETGVRQVRPDAVIMRFAGIYGPGRLLRSRDLLAGTSLAIDPEKWLNLIQVEDGAVAVLTACEKALPGSIINVCDDRPVRRREFYTALAALLGAPVPTFIPSANPTSAGERVNRRISNKRLREELGLVLRYPTYEQGLRGSIG